jgi:hypothetical protein
LTRLTPDGLLERDAELAQLTDLLRRARSVSDRPGLVRRCAVVAILALLGAAGSAQAAAWRELTPGQPVPTGAAPGVARSGDGVLHVLWPRAEGQAGSIQHNAVSASGTGVSGPNQVFSYTHGSSQSVAVIRVDEGLRAFFSGLMGTLGHPQEVGVETALSTDGGGSWTPSPTIVSNNTPGNISKAYTAGIGAARGSANVPIFAWGDTDPGSGGYHVGLDPAAPDVHIGSTTECCEYSANVAVDGGTGAPFVAWKYVYGGSSGTAVQALGSRELLQPPNGSAVEAEFRTPITGRIGAGGVFLAYQFGTNPFSARPAVWNVTARRLVNDSSFKHQADAQAIGISPGPAGKLWVFYRRGARLYATRSNGKATRFGAIVSVPTLPGQPQLLNLVGEGSAGPLDLVAVFRNAGGSSLWHRRLLAGLSLAAEVTGHNVTLTVTDAGAKVKGAKVGLAGKSATTGSSGKVAFTIGRSGKYTATASKKGYAPARRKLKVR